MTYPNERISVRDKLPEEGRPVMAYVCRTDVYTCTYQCVAFHINKHRIPDEYLEGWYEVSYNGEESDICINDLVTHWMPLPKPPSHMGGK
ncbi:MAG: DUF551 domain-containing protein [Bacteroides sp.]|nr:DUF551 domain-containing protein [Bacteroides sp.]